MISFVPQTKLQITIAVACAVIGATATVSWVFANGLRDVKDEIAGLRSDVANVRHEAWTYTDHSRWVSVFARDNRFNSIEVPLVPERPNKKPN